MSWLFGFNKPPPPSDEPPLIPSRPLRDGNWENEGVRIASVSRSFNPLVLERAAEAVRVLENSQHSKEILEIARLQEETKLLEQQCKIKEYEVNIQKMQMEKMRVEQEEKRKTLVEETQQHQQHAQYQDQLARKRYEDQLSQQRHMIEEKFAKHEQSVKKREAMKRGTMEYEAQIKHENEMKRLQAELRGKASIERESKDIRMEQIKLEAVLQSIKILGSILEAGFSSCMSDWNKISIVAGGLTFVAFSVFTAKHGTGVTANCQAHENWSHNQLFEMPARSPNNSTVPIL